MNIIEKKTFWSQNSPKFMTSRQPQTTVKWDVDPTVAFNEWLCLICHLAMLKQ